MQQPDCSPSYAPHAGERGSTKPASARTTLDAKEKSDPPNEGAGFDPKGRGMQGALAPDTPRRRQGPQTVGAHA